MKLRALLARLHSLRRPRRDGPVVRQAAAPRLLRRLDDLPGLSAWRRGLDSAVGQADGWMVCRLAIEAGASDLPQAVGPGARLCVAQALMSALRDGERLARDEGRGFLLALPPGHAGGVRIVAEHLRALVRAIEWREDHAGPLVPLGLSVGATRLLAGEPLEAALARAEQALLLARRDARQGVAVIEG